MEIRPFRGWHYRGPNVSNQIAPPYDVLDQDDKDRLLDQDRTNIVAVDLPHVPPKQVGPDEDYHFAAKLLQKWKKREVICHDEKPALYAYEQTYTWAGKTYSRRALIAGVRATPLGADVIPHEHTFAGPKADRLKLTTVTKMQLSPIFGFFSDPGKGIIDSLWQAAPDCPTLDGKMNDVQEKLWVVTDPDAIGQVTAALDEEKVYIADGHHRYTTAMNYCQALRDAGLIDEDHPANFVMFALVDRDDPGLLVLPTHRIVRCLKDDFSAEVFCNALAGHFEVNAIDPPEDISDADAFLDPYPPNTMAMLIGEQVFTVKLRDGQSMQALAPDACEAWRQLDVAILQELILQDALQPWRDEELQVDYTPDGNHARREVTDGRASVAFILRHTPLWAVQAVADAGESMPHKSTYFYPKLATGMVLKPLE